MNGQDPTDFKLSFGKHKGKLASEVPVSYLDWLLDWDDLWEDTRNALLRHLETRREWN